MVIDDSLKNLEEFGWDAFFAGEFRKPDYQGLVPARVVTLHKSSCRVRGEQGEMTATISGRLRYRADRDNPYPVVGDWVAVRPQANEQKATIRAILPRKSSFSRRISGGRGRLSGGLTQEQVVAANVDTVFLVSGLDGGRNFNLRSIERYLILAWNSGARPVIILNKADLCPDVESKISEVEEIASGVPVHAVSAKERWNLDSVSKYIQSGNTAALLGRSGVGKSAIINALLGAERQTVGDVSERDRRGRHTTSRRELILLPDGGAVIDTPGMREIQVWSDEESFQDTFEDIEKIAGQCRFADCRHDTEPECAVRTAIENGTLDEARFLNYLKLQRELRHLEARRDDLARLEEKEKRKKISLLVKEFKKIKKNTK